MHIHSVLSPCGDLDMSPSKIINEALRKGLEMIAITDHNSTLHAPVMVELGQKSGITVIPGAELTSAEEVHCLAFFENTNQASKFQSFIDRNLSHIPNIANRFGMQLLVNEKEEIIDEVSELLILALSATIEEIEQAVHKLNGVFIPAHVDRTMNGIYSQIGFLPLELSIDAIEFSANSKKDNLLLKYPELQQYNLISNSDAHYLSDIGSTFTEYFLEEPSFSEWKMALKNENNRTIRTK